MKRRKYKADPTSFAKVIAETELFNEAEIRDMTLRDRVAFQDLIDGTATPQQVRYLVNTMNVTLVRSWGSPMQQLAQPAVAALKRAWERFERLGKMGLDGPALSEIEQGLQLHEELLRLSTPRQMREAAIVVDELRRKHDRLG